jgi:heme A synthase
MMRRKLGRFVHGFVPIVLLTGFFVAGTNAGVSCNTFPFVGENFFYGRKHMISNIPTW